MVWGKGCLFVGIALTLDRLFARLPWCQSTFAVTDWLAGKGWGFWLFIKICFRRLFFGGLGFIAGLCLL